jgi:hypothetical protein
MDAIMNILTMLLNFLLGLLELFITFIITALTMVLNFAKAVVGTVI